MADRTPYVIAGLGNPGAEYAGTRHNIGFDTIEHAAELMNAGPFRPDGDAEYVRVPYRGADVLLVRPLTFMNASGRAVRRIAAACGSTLERILVILDDVHLPLGSLRLRPRGGDGGHNGMASVIAELGSPDVPRLRVGVGNADVPADDLVPFVLGRFGAAEQDDAAAAARRAAGAAAAFVQHGAEHAMNEFNNKPFLPHLPKE